MEELLDSLHRDLQLDKVAEEDRGLDQRTSHQAEKDERTDGNLVLEVVTEAYVGRKCRHWE